MRAMVMRGPTERTDDEVGSPSLKDGHVLVRITHSGLCGTDLKIYQGAIPARYPLIMGHEMVGEIVDGASAGLRPGDRVIVDPVLFCGTCFHCRVGQMNLCPNGGLIGRDTDGGFAEYAAFPASQIFRLPESVDSRTAPLIQVATTCLHAQRLTPFFLGESVAVVGLGVSGQLHVQIAKARGAGTVIGISRSPFKRDMARQLGADITLDSGDATVQQVLDATGGRGADVVIESTGVLASLAQAIRMVPSAAPLVITRPISAEEGALPFYQLYFKELTLINGRAAKAEDFTGMIDLVYRGAVRLEPLVTHRMPLADLTAAIGMGEDGADARLKVILDHE